MDETDFEGVPADNNNSVPGMLDRALEAEANKPRKPRTKTPARLLEVAGIKQREAGYRVTKAEKALRLAEDKFEAAKEVVADARKVFEDSLEYVPED